MTKVVQQLQMMAVVTEHLIFFCVIQYSAVCNFSISVTLLAFATETIVLK